MKLSGFLRPTLLFCAVFALVQSLAAADFEQDGISYDFLSKENLTVKVVYNDATPYAGDVTIPPYVEYEGETYTVAAISDQAFFKCADLSYVSIPATVEALGRYTFSNCTSLEGVDLPQSITTIPEGCFVYCTSLTSVKLPESVTAVNKFGFGYCSKLSDIILPSNLSFLGDQAFIGCAMASVALPSKITSLPQFCFALNTSLTTVTLHEGITSIGNSVFEGDTQLTDVRMSDALETIGSRAFAQCLSLKSITIPNGVSTIPDQCFYNDMALQRIVAGSSVTSFGLDVLVRYKNTTAAPALKDLYITGDVMATGAVGFMAEARQNTTVHVKPELVDTYKKNFEWRLFKDIVPISEGELTAIGSVVNSEATSSAHACYTVDGIRIDAPRKGLTIRDGKKFVTK